MSVGILCIATGKYIKFFEQFWQSSEKYFMPDTKKIYFLFTDSDLDFSTYGNVVPVYQRHELWPAPTMYRYRYFMNAVGIIRSMNVDYLFYSDVDMRFCAKVDENEVLFPLMAVYHPGFYNTNQPWGTPETRAESRVYIQDIQNHKYVCGGVQGGKTDLYLQAIENMRDAIDDDVSRGIIPVFHDESAWNKFVNVNKSIFTILTPEYCYPQSWNLPYTPKILALDKNHAEMRRPM